MKEALIIGGSAAVGTWATQKWGAQLEAQAVKLHVPPTFAHMAVVGSFTALSWFVLKHVI